MYNDPLKIDSTLLGERIKRRRKELGYSQADMAKELNIPSSSMSYYEHGQAIPSLDKMFAISEYLHISMDYLVGRSEMALETLHSEKDLAELVVRLISFEGIELAEDANESAILTFSSTKMQEYLQTQIEIKSILSSDMPEEYKKELCKAKNEICEYQLCSLENNRAQPKDGSVNIALRRKR